jgi:hypothetical protein
MVRSRKLIVLSCSVSIVYSKEMFGILGNPKVHCRIHTSPPACSCILSQVDPVHVLPSYFFNNHFNFIIFVQQVTIYVNNYLFSITLLHVSMSTRHPQGVFCYVC